MLRTKTAIVMLLSLVALATGLAEVRSGAASPVAEEPRNLVVAFNDVDIEFDPHHSIYASEAQVFTALYEGLFTYDPATLEPIKGACASFTRSKDGLTYTFTLRPEALWSDGSPLLAAHFRDAWLRALDPAQKADYAAFFDIISGAKDYRLGKNPDRAKVGIQIRGERILEVKLDTPAAYFTRLLCHHAFSPIHPSLLNSHDWASRIPFPVNGPFLIASRGKGELVLAKNLRYWDAASVKIPGIKLLFSDDDNDMTRRFDNGEIDWLAGPMNLDNILTRSAIHAGPMFGTQYWFFDCSKPPFDSSDLRQALALLLPWKEIRASESYLSPAETLVLPLEGYGEARGISAPDETRAKKLLSDSGHPDSIGIPPIIIVIPEGADDATRVSGTMKTAWEKAGMTVDVRAVPSARYLEAARPGKGAASFTLALSTWIGDFADPLAFLQMWESDSNLNDARFSDPEFDRLLADSAALEGPKRLSALAKAETRLLESAACLPLHHSIALNVLDGDAVEGWSDNALDIHPFKYLGFGQARIRPGVIKAEPLAPKAQGSVVAAALNPADMLGAPEIARIDP